MRITVSREYLGGDWRRVGCPVTQAIKVALGLHPWSSRVSVLSRDVVVYTQDFAVASRTALPPEATAFVLSLYAGTTPAPFSFDLEMGTACASPSPA